MPLVKQVFNCEDPTPSAMLSSPAKKHMPQRRAAIQGSGEESVHYRTRTLSEEAKLYIYNQELQKQRGIMLSPVIESSFRENLFSENTVLPLIQLQAIQGSATNPTTGTTSAAKYSHPSQPLRDHSHFYPGRVPLRKLPSVRATYSCGHSTLSSTPTAPDSGPSHSLIPIYAIETRFLASSPRYPYTGLYSLSGPDESDEGESEEVTQGLDGNRVSLSTVFGKEEGAMTERESKLHQGSVDTDSDSDDGKLSPLFSSHRTMGGSPFGGKENSNNHNKRRYTRKREKLPEVKQPGQVIRKGRGRPRKHPLPAPISTAGRRPSFPTLAVKLLSNWMEAHLLDPYPTMEEMHSFREKTGLTTAQLRSWFVNTRTRRKDKPWRDNPNCTGWTSNKRQRREKITHTLTRSPFKSKVSPSNRIIMARHR